MQSTSMSTLGVGATCHTAVLYGAAVASVPKHCSFSDAALGFPTSSRALHHRAGHVNSVQNYGTHRRATTGSDRALRLTDRPELRQ
jgi:hypothetical protein